MRRLLFSMVLVAACDSGGDKPAAAKPEAAAKSAAAEKSAKAEKPETEVAGAAVVASGPKIDHVVKTITGDDKNLADYRGKALLVVNTASECGYTPQYEGLQELYAKYKDQGFEVLAFPSNDFGAQEPGTPEEIAKFVSEKYGAEFPMFAKVPVKGADKVPLFKTLTEETGEGIRGEVKWNFTKFLIDTNGQVVARFDSAVDPMDKGLTAKLEAILPKA